MCILGTLTFDRGNCYTIFMRNLFFSFCLIVTTMAMAQSYPSSDYDNVVLLDNEPENAPVVNKRNLVFTYITKDGHVSCGGMQLKDGVSIVKLLSHIIVNPDERTNYPKVVYDTIPTSDGDYILRYTNYYLWIGKDQEVSVNDHTFRRILHDYVITIHELRDEYSRTFLNCPYKELSYELKQGIDAIFPATIYVRSKTPPPPPPPVPL